MIRFLKKFWPNFKGSSPSEEGRLLGAGALVSRALDTGKQQISGEHPHWRAMTAKAGGGLSVADVTEVKREEDIWDICLTVVKLKNENLPANRTLLALKARADLEVADVEKFKEVSLLVTRNDRPFETHTDIGPFPGDKERGILVGQYLAAKSRLVIYPSD